MCLHKKPTLVPHVVFWAYGYPMLRMRHYLTDQYTISKVLRAQSLVISSAVNNWGCFKIRNIYMIWLTMSPLMFCLWCIFMQITIIWLDPLTPLKLHSHPLVCAIPQHCGCIEHLQGLKMSQFLSYSLYKECCCLLSDLEVFSLNACTVTFDWKYWSGSYCFCTTF